MNRSVLHENVDQIKQQNYVNYPKVNVFDHILNDFFPMISHNQV
jgi:hypothetical protein